MNITIIHSVCSESAKFLKEYLDEGKIHNVRINNVGNTGQESFPNQNIIALGCSGASYGAYSRINKAAATKQCVDKRLSFASFNRAKVDTVGWTTDYKKIPKEWDQIVVRTSATGRKAEDIEYYLRDTEYAPIPKTAALYTQCFYGDTEYRIVVFRGNVVGRYRKDEKNGEWIFNLVSKRGFDKMDDHCVRAAVALGIDYVGFDVLAATKQKFAILEANSGATMQHEAATAFFDYFHAN